MFRCLFSSPKKKALISHTNISKLQPALRLYLPGHKKYLYWIICLGVLQRFGCWLLLWSRNSSFYASVPQTNFHQAGMGDDTTTTCTSSTQPRNFFTLKAPGRMYGKKRNFENRSTQAYGVDSKRISFHNNSHPTCTTLRIILFLFDTHTFIS